MDLRLSVEEPRLFSGLGLIAILVMGFVETLFCRFRIMSIKLIAFVSIENLILSPTEELELLGQINHGTWASGNEPENKVES